MFKKIIILCVIIELGIALSSAYARANDAPTSAPKRLKKTNFSRALFPRNLLPPIRPVEKDDRRVIDRSFADTLSLLLNTVNVSRYNLIEEKFDQGIKPSLDVFQTEQVLDGSCITRTAPNQTVAKKIKTFVSENNEHVKAVRILPHQEEHQLRIFTPLVENYPDDLPLGGIFKLRFKNSLIYSHRETKKENEFLPKTLIYRLRQVPQISGKTLFVIQQLCNESEGCAYGNLEELDDIGYGEPIQYCIFEQK